MQSSAPSPHRITATMLIRVPTARSRQKNVLQCSSAPPHVESKKRINNALQCIKSTKPPHPLPHTDSSKKTVQTVCCSLVHSPLTRARPETTIFLGFCGCRADENYSSGFVRWARERGHMSPNGKSAVLFLSFLFRRD